MRIPLDYYRILGVPIQAAAEQLQQAYSDRIVQLPRREYSDLAIAARKQLLDEAYSVLRDPEQRQAYDASFLSNTYERGVLNALSGYPPDSPVKTVPKEQSSEVAPTFAPTLSGELSYPAPSIEIAEAELIGALLILQELGEYELVLKLGSSYLNNNKAQIENSRFGDAKITRQDIILTIALASLELGREQWQQRRYEDAGTSLNEGQELLLREGIFAGVRGEIQADLYKLRPYRILELVALAEDKQEQRHQGIQLLREMLQERGGMDGNGNDQSGLSVDDFLRFIQQLRPYLTAAEQQVLFEDEARRPSAVATYLAVYALLARGFEQRQPGLIRRAKQMLMRLGKRQDVHLEQAVCALLLGQTEEASRALEFSGEYESLAFIREHSQGAPDLLPGLCLYSEHWLQSEVFPHFRDLAKQKVSLKDYFADEQLQTSLETLPAADDSSEWEVVGSQRLSVTSASTGVKIGESAKITALEAENETVKSLKTQIQRTKAIIESKSGQESVAGAGTMPRNPPSSDRAFAKGSIPTTIQNTNSTNVQTLPAAERVEPQTSEGEYPSSLEELPDSGSSSAGQSFGENGNDSLGSSPPAQRVLGKGETARPNQGKKRNPRGKQLANLNPKNWFLGQRRSSGEGATHSPTAKQIPPKLLLLGAVGLGIFLLFVVWAQKAFFSKPPQPANLPVVQQVEPSPAPTPTNDTSLLSSPGPVTPEVAQQAIETWLFTKAKAFGPKHDIDSLKEILVNPALSERQTLAQTSKRKNSYQEYKHEVKPDSIKIRQINANQARVEAQVSESAQYFDGGKLNQNKSYDSNLRVRYDLVRQNGQWRIQNMKVL